jgi:hypothetical protein
MKSLALFLAPVFLCLPAIAQPVTELTGDLRALSQKSGPAPELTRQIAAHITALQEKTHEPSAVSVQQFAADLARFLEGKPATGEQAQKLAAHIDKVLKSAGTSTMDFNATVSDFEVTLKAIGVTGLYAHAAANRLENIGKQVRGPDDSPVRGRARAR